MTKNAEKYEHLVISGGGISGFYLYNALRDSNLRGEWNIKNIKSIHAVSAGTVIAAIIALRYDWSITDEYFISRPLINLFKWENLSMMSVFYNCGIIDRTVFVDFLRPLFAGAIFENSAVDIDIDITMHDFYEKTGISLHFYCTDISIFEKIEMSPIKTPDLSVIDAIYRSCTIPFIMCPQRGSHITKNNVTESSEREQISSPPRKRRIAPVYIDGYLKTNYPSLDCINTGANEDNILGFRLNTEYNDDINNMIDLAKSIIFAPWNTVYQLKHEYVIEENYFNTFDDLYLFFKSATRRRYVIRGICERDNAGES